MKNRLTLSIVPLIACVFLTACALGPHVETRVYETSTGAVVVQSVEWVATVQSIDGVKREVTLKPKHGDAQVFKASDEAVNFDQVQVGDEVHAEVVEEMAVTLIPGGEPSSVGEAELVALAPEGEKPSVVMVETEEITAEIVGIDAHSHQVTLQFVDGTTEAIKVGKHIDLSTVALGDSVRIQVTEAVVIAVVKPTKN